MHGVSDLRLAGATIDAWRVDVLVLRTVLCKLAPVHNLKTNLRSSLVTSYIRRTYVVRYMHNWPNWPDRLCSTKKNLEDIWTIASTVKL